MAKGISRRQLLIGTVGVGLSLYGPAIVRAATARKRPNDVTFLFINDVHACRMGNTLSPQCTAAGKTDANLIRNIAALNNITRHKWPETIDGKSTGLASAGDPIATPEGVIVCGDITDDGGGQTSEPRMGSQLVQFSRRYRQGTGIDQVHYPVYVGLGNHDLDQDGKPPNRNWYREQMREYVRLNHKPSVFYKAPVPVDNYDTLSDNYSWNWGRLHLIQAQRFPGDTSKGAISSLAWLKNDLATYAADGRPVVIFQHYGWDPFSIERWDPPRKTFDKDGSGPPHWWSDNDREALVEVLAGYNIAGIFHGHEHDRAMIYQASGMDLFKPKAAFKGGFGLARINGQRMDVVLGEATDENGGVVFTAAFSKELLTGPYAVTP